MIWRSAHLQTLWTVGLGALLAISGGCEDGVSPTPGPDAEADAGTDAGDAGPPPATGRRACEPGELPSYYTLRDLGTFSRDNEGLANGMALNERGEVVGIAEEVFAGGRYTSDAFYWSGGNEKIQRIDAPDGASAFRGHDINEGGEVVGHGMATQENGSGLAAAFYWPGDGELSIIGARDAASFAEAINDEGLVVGRDAEGGFVWDARTGEMVARHIGIGMPTRERTAGLTDINDRGVAVGASTVASGNTNPIVWTREDGAFRLTLPAYDGRVYAEARGINEAGDIVVEVGGAANECLLYRAGAYERPEPLGLLDGYYELDGCRIEAINERGQIVGADNANLDRIHPRPWIYIDGEKHDLNALIVSHQAKRWDLSVASDINDAGAITGTGTFDGIPGRAYVATPACGVDPEPEPEPVVLPTPERRSYCRADRYDLSPLPLGEAGVTGFALSVDERGRAAGMVELRSGARRAARWAEGMVELIDDDEGFPRGSSYGLDINDAGEVAGFGLHRWTDDGNGPRAFVWLSEGLDDISAANHARAWLLDDSGRVAGDIGTEAFFYTPERGLLRLGFTVGPSLESHGNIFGMNESGAFVGASWSGVVRTPFVYDDETSGYQALDLGAAEEGEAHGINDAGDVVGKRWSVGEPHVATLWASGGAPVSLGVLDGLRGGEARDINAAGEIVGYDAENIEREGATAWIHRDGEKHDLNTLVDDADGWQLEVAYDISDAGQIVGYGTLDDEGPLPFLLTPQCE